MGIVQPIIILGTGRCGSTYLQTSLCGASDIWIWGEHDGILRGLFAWSQAARNSKALQSFGFPFVGEDPYITMKRDGTRAAWLSPFDAEGITGAERKLLVDLFTRRLPPGKNRWGFKEIRYGAQSRVPERMLELFPATKIIHVVRHPQQTISSSIRAWRPEIFQPQLSDGELRKIITRLVCEEMMRWKETTNYLEDFREANPTCVMTVHIEEVEHRLSDILGFLEASTAANPVEVAREVNPARSDKRISELISEAYETTLRDDPAFVEAACRVSYAA